MNPNPNPKCPKAKISPIMNRVLLSSSMAPPTTSAVHSNTSHGLTPSMLFIIVILTIIFFLSGLLHLLVRFLVRAASARYRDDAVDGSVTAIQGQLRQLFYLHDAGLDQSFIDNLPVFVYKAIIGSQNDPFDCAICLCEFQPEDELRLIPKCSHAFHMGCIDTWLLSHSSCPLCRANLLHDGFSSKDGNHLCSSPVVAVLESGSDTSQELSPDSQSMCPEIPTISSGFDMKDKQSREEKVVAVKLGKFRNSEDGEGSSCRFDDGGMNNVDGRRCFSMGSFAYIMDDTSSLWVPIRTRVQKQLNKKSPFPLAPSHQLAMSECDCESTREFPEFERANTEINNRNSKHMIGDENEIVNRGTRKESFSISKIWLRDKKERPAAESSRRAFSFRFPITRNQEAAGSEMRHRECDDEGEQSNRRLGSLQGNWDDVHASSFARRTLFWILGRQNVKVVHSSNNV